MEAFAEPQITDSDNGTSVSRNGSTACDSDYFKTLDGCFEGGEDRQSKEQKLEEHYKSMLNTSSNREAALDIFLMLDWENDQYLKQEEIEPMWHFIEKLSEADRGKITSKEELINFFRKH